MSFKNYAIALVSILFTVVLIFFFIDQSAREINAADGASLVSVISLLYLSFLSKGIYTSFTKSIKSKFLNPLSFFVNSTDIIFNPWHISMLVSTGSIIPFALFNGVSLQDAVGVFGATILHYYLTLYFLIVLNHFLDQNNFYKTVDAISAFGLLFLVLTNYFDYAFLQLANPIGSLFYLPVIIIGSPDLISWGISIGMAAFIITTTYLVTKRMKPSLFT